MRVVAAPERGRANDAVVDLLTVALGVKRGDIEIVAGRGGRDKVAALQGLSSTEAARRLDAASSGGDARGG